MGVLLVCWKDTTAASERQAIIFTCFDFPDIWHGCDLLSCMTTLGINAFTDRCVPSTVLFFPQKSTHWLLTSLLLNFYIPLELLYSMTQRLNYSKQQRELDLVLQLFPSMLVQPLSALILNTYFQGKESEGWIRPVGSHRERWGSTPTINSFYVYKAKATNGKQIWYEQGPQISESFCYSKSGFRTNNGNYIQFLSQSADCKCDLHRNHL